MAYGVTQCGIPYRGELDLDKEEREYILYIEIYLLFWKKYGRRIGKGSKYSSNIFLIFRIMKISSNSIISDII